MCPTFVSFHSLSTWNPSWWQLCFSKDAASSPELSIVLPHVNPQAHLESPDCVWCFWADPVVFAVRFDFREVRPARVKIQFSKNNLLSRAAKLHNCQWRWHATPLHSTLPLPLSNQRLAAPFCGTITSAYWKIIALSPECDACHIANPEHRMPLCSWPLFALKAWLRLRRSPKARGSGAW